MLARTPSFTWDVPANRKGFCLRGKDEEYPHRLEELPGNAVDSYAPLQEETGLFLNFAHLSPKAESVLDFANRYGLLRTRMALLPVPESYESLQSWLQEIAWMRASVELWEHARAGAVDALAACLFWTDGGRKLRFKPAARQPAQEFNETESAELGPLDRNDLASAAFFVLHDRVNARLLADEKPRVELEWNHVTRRSSLVVMPENLLQAMLLQFAAAVSEDKQFRACRECGRWFELVPGARQDYRLTCSATCRIRTYRKRMASAREMRAAGKPVREIAKALEVDEETVKKWLQAKG